MTPYLRGLRRSPTVNLIGEMRERNVVGVALHPKMAEEEDRDREDRELPAERDHRIDASFFAIALILAGVIVFELLFG